MYSGTGFPYTLITATQMGLSVFQENISFFVIKTIKFRQIPA